MAASLALSLIGREAEGERNGNWNCNKILRNEQREAATTPMEWETDRKDGTSGIGKEMWDSVRCAKWRPSWNEVVKWYWRKWQMSDHFGKFNVIKLAKKYWEDDEEGDTFIWRPPWNICWSIV